MKVQFDYIIVGQGIAGTLMAYGLLKRKKNILVIDQPKPVNSSLIAAGLFNPVVFKRIVPSWQASTLLPFNHDFYAQLEHFLSIKFYYTVDFQKVIESPTEQQLWLRKARSATLSGFIADTLGRPLSAKVFQKNFVTGRVYHAGYIDLQRLLNTFRNFLKEKAMLREDSFDFGKLLLHEQNVDYDGLKAKKIIFCEGYRIQHNPYFNWLPLKPVKGEILKIKTATIIARCIINKGFYVLPLGNNIYKVGATHKWDYTDSLPSEQGRQELTGKLESLIKIPYQVIDHQAGIRPAVEDRRPLIGLHLKYPQLGVFNGLGSKGVMLAPYFSNQFCEHIINDHTLNKEVKIARYKHLMK